ncbi:hypothetical protein KQI65_01800 [bacterium]|nr:hypothetical protein [bacterium]
MNYTIIDPNSDQIISSESLTLAVQSIELACERITGVDAKSIQQLHQQSQWGRAHCESLREMIRSRLHTDPVKLALSETPQSGPTSSNLRTADQLELKRLTKLLRRFTRCGRVLSRAHSQQSRIERLELDKSEAEILVRSQNYLQRYSSSIENSISALPQRQYDLSCGKKGKVQQRADTAIEQLLTPEAIPDEATLLGFVKAVNEVLHTKVVKSPREYRERFIEVLRDAVADLRKNAGIGNKKTKREVNS